MPSLARLLAPGRFAVLAAVQLLLAAYCVCLFVFAPGVAPAPDNIAAAGVLVALAAVTAFVRPSAPLEHVLVLCTSAMVAALTAVRTTGQGQLVMGLFVLMVAMWSAAYLRPPMAIVHATVAAGLWVLAIALRPHTASPVYVAAVLIGIAFATAVVLLGRASWARYAGLVSNSPDIVLRSDHGRITWVSANVQGVLGWTPREFVALPEPFWHPDDEATVQRMRRTLYTGAPAAGTYRHRHKDGTYRWMEARLNPISVADATQGGIGSLRDVTERVEAELALADSASRQRRGLKRMRRADAAKTRMVHDLSHELRTPLTVIRGPLERHLRRGTDLPDGLRQDIETAVRASRRLENLVNDILDVERRAAQARSTLSATDVATLTDETVRLLQAGADATGLTLTFQSSVLFPQALLVDADAWSRIVLNLVSNGLKYTDTGGVHVRLAYDTDAIVLTVEDTGRGIAEDDVQRVFDRFYTAGAQPSRGAARSGLGLTVVADDVHAGGGHIDVMTEVGVGTTFVVTLPAVPCEVDALSRPRPTTLRQPSDDAESEEPVGDAIVLLMADSGLTFEQALSVLRTRAGDRPLADAAAELLAEADAGEDAS